MEQLTTTKPMVYVQAKDGTPLMPTIRYGWVRRALKDKRAKVVTTVPFVIRLTYEPETKECQPVAYGNDPGRKNLGAACVREDGTVLYRAKLVTRNEEIPKLMQERRAHRMARRRGERKAKQRRAKRYHTMFAAGMKMRKLPLCEEPILCKYIKNTEARFCNRRRPKGWLTPTATQLLSTHLNLLKKVQKILPITDVALEVNRFDFVKMDHPDTYKSEYGKGPRRGYGSEKEAVSAMQDGKCLLCQEASIDHIHHIVPVSKGGSENLNNKAGLCQHCHNLVHTDAQAQKKLSTLKAGINKMYHSLSVLNQIMPKLVQELAALFPGHVYLTTGQEVKAYREAFDLSKDHDLDAVLIAMAALGFQEPDLKYCPECYDIRQYRRHDRAIIKAQTFRSYYLDGKKVCQNRKPATEALPGEGTKKKKYPSLLEWYEDMVQKCGEKNAQHMRSILTVKPSARRYNNPDRLLPGAVFFYKGERHVMSGQITNGKYLHAYGDTKSKKTNYPAKDCVIYPNAGLVYVG